MFDSHIIEKINRDNAVVRDILLELNADLNKYAEEFLPIAQKAFQPLFDWVKVNPQFTRPYHVKQPNITKYRVNQKPRL